MKKDRKKNARKNRRKTKKQFSVKGVHSAECPTVYSEENKSQLNNSKKSGGPRITRFRHWFRKKLCCTSLEVQDELDNNTIGSPQISVPTNTLITSPSIENLHNLHHETTNHVSVIPLESSTLDSNNIQSKLNISKENSVNSRIRTRSGSIDINESVKSLDGSIDNKHISMKCGFPQSNARNDDVSQFLPERIDQVGDNNSISTLPSMKTYNDHDGENYCRIVNECATDAKTTILQSFEISSQSTSKSREVLKDAPIIPTKFVPGRCGLENLGNTCFMNSALQCLSNVSDLTNYILKHGLNSSINWSNCLGTEGKVATAYEQMIKEMWSGNTQSFSPYTLKKHVSELFPRFAGYGQQDSHEFLNALLDALHEDLKRDSADSSDSSSADETSLISDIFHGKIRSTVMCDECKEPYWSYDSISFLALPIPDTQDKSCRRNQSGKKSKPSVNLSICFDQFLKPEILNEDNQWYCEKCGHLTNAERKLDIWTLPKILIIQLKRFSYDLSNNRKIETFIDYPLRFLDLNGLVTNPTGDKSARYDLIAVSAHTGSLVGGHYTVFAKNFHNQQWYHFNDATVRDVEETVALTGNAYILVYCKQES